VILWHIIYASAANKLPESPDALRCKKGISSKRCTAPRAIRGKRKKNETRIKRNRPLSTVDGHPEKECHYTVLDMEGNRSGIFYNREAAMTLAQSKVL